MHRCYISGWRVTWQYASEHIRGWELPVFREKETNDSKGYQQFIQIPFGEEIIHKQGIMGMGGGGKILELWLQPTFNFLEN